MLHQYLNVSVAMRKRIHSVPPPGFAYASMEEYVLREGSDFVSEPLTDAEMRWIFAAIGDTRFQIKQCYYNAQRLLTHASFQSNPDGHELRYVEGYASGLIPCLHGWLSLNGKVVDLTMRLRNKLPRRKSTVGRRRLQNRVLGEFPADDRQYRGVTFETDFVHARIVRTGMMGTLIDDWENGYPLLKLKEAV